MGRLPRARALEDFSQVQKKAVEILGNGYTGDLMSREIRSKCNLVFIVDEGSVFDAPLEKIWRYLQTPPDIHDHPQNRNVRTEMQPDGTMHLSFENEGPGGTMMKNKLKLTMVPPIGFVSEYIEGPMTGSRSMQYYQPMGEKTGVTVVGEYVSKVLPEQQIKPIVNESLETAFTQDNANLKKFK